MRICQTGVLVGSEGLGVTPLVREGDLSCYLSLKVEVGSFFIPHGKGGRHSVHSLDVMHDPGRESCREIGDQGGGVFLFVVLCSNDVQLERVDIFLELFPRVNTGGG